MFFSASIAALALLVSPAFAAPSNLKTVTKFAGEKKANSYIVKYKEGVTAASFAGARSSAGIAVTNEYSAVFNGFSADLTAEALDALRANPDVESIDEDGIMHAFVTQTNAPWGLARLSSAGPTGGSVGGLAFSYTYDATAGAGVDVYIADTGINTAHTDFGGRASFVFAASGFAQADGNGHGTHCAGTIGGTRYGVAKRASLFAVKILSDAGSGSVAGIVAGLDFIKARAASTGRPSVVSMSLGGGVSAPLDTAVSSLISAGIHVVVAAGNSNVNAANTSPARVAAAITVGASTITDARSSFSNFGPVVDVFAPGTSVISTWIGSTTATNSISGTSMATPHVAGLAAYLIALQGNVSPAALSAKIVSLSSNGILTGIPSGTANRLANNN